MSKICYIKRRFSRSNLNIIDNVNDIITLYKQYKRKPTTSNIFNRMVREGSIEDTRRDYKRLVLTIGNARTAGLIGWDDIDGRKQTHKGDKEL